MYYDMREAKVIDERDDVFLKRKQYNTTMEAFRCTKHAEKQFARMKKNLAIAVFGGYYLALLPYMDQFARRGSVWESLIFFLLVPALIYAVAYKIMHRRLNLKLTRQIEAGLGESMDFLVHLVEVRTFNYDLSSGRLRGITGVREDGIEAEVMEGGCPERTFYKLITEVKWGAEETMVRLQADKVVLELPGEQM